MEGGPPRFPPGSTCLVVLGYPVHSRNTHLTYRAITCCGGTFQTLRICESLKRASDTKLRQDPTTSWQQRVSAITPPGFGLLPVRSPLLGQSRLIFFRLRLLRCFTSPRIAPCTYELSARLREISHVGFPHSDIFGSMLACSSPKLIAACHVLHRRSKPRHPPSALSSLTTENLSARHKQLSKTHPRCTLGGAEVKGWVFSAGHQ